MIAMAITAATAVVSQGAIEAAHPLARGGKPDQRDDREGQSEAQHHLAQNQQSVGRTRAPDKDGGNRRDDGDEPGQKPPCHRIQSDIDETLHDDLTGKRRRQSRVQAAGDQGNREELGGERASQQGRDQTIGVRQHGHLRMAMGVERRGRENQDRTIDQKREETARSSN